MLSDELSDEDMARYEAARERGDAMAVLDLLAPSSTSPLVRVCRHFGVKPDAAAGRSRKPSMWSRWFGR